MKIRLTIYLSDRDRRAIARRHGKRGRLVTRQEARDEIESLIQSDLDAQIDECCDFHREGGPGSEPCVDDVAPESTAAMPAGA